ncbi:L,D-transpeptidase-like protein [Thermolongibacillus altinsuensis]|jgi:lipoprotein-anchoring transpeptidase ErfK/SrfK|uniref:L,D-transpeptidase-like protein n=1 Tax=Thermolongibacillus altinsuensis TaxID=575256 RepID=A0A4R1QQH0_9BACL|nr:L,D-transpeptidase [Thermolongibacillus altinsuensis]TCL53014.1 L,D-transpeptidase-like protein [Thermolongibacillus altinsuensis]GMB07717.1 transpeptidase [Thermolongibacillus altinsuensis]
MPLLLALFLLISPLWPLGQNPRVGDPMLIVNKQTNQLAFIRNGKIENVYRVATGKTNQLTPEGLFTVTVKAINPYYRKKNIPGGAPNNPLGSRWIGFDAKGTEGRTYGIHGTNAPSSIGRYISQGCIRMHNREIEALFPKVPIGTKVAVVKSYQSFEQLGKQYGAIKR